MGDDNIWKYEDLSYVNVCILTKAKTKVNEEIIIEYGNGKQFSIGVVEDACFLNPFDEFCVDNKGENMVLDQTCSEDESDDDGISDSISMDSVQEKPLEVEDGEIFSEEDDAGNSPAGDDVVVEESSFNMGGNSLIDKVNDDGSCNNDDTPVPILPHTFPTLDNLNRDVLHSIRATSDGPVLKCGPFSFRTLSRSGPFSFRAHEKCNSRSKICSCGPVNQNNSQPSDIIGNSKKRRRQFSPSRDD